MRYKIKFPPAYSDDLQQNETYFYLNKNLKDEKILFHDYARIYKEPGLYEQLFYDRLKCNSPKTVTESLKYTIDVNKNHFSELKVLDFGAGNGIMGEELKKTGVARLVGVDVLPEARDATDRDRPGVYDEYFVKDFTTLSKHDKEEIKSWHLNTLTTIAALGFGDIPPIAFVEALNLIDREGWLAFNIKETFLYDSDKSGFSKLIRELIFSEFLNINHLVRYRHRMSIDGKPLYYFSIICWKRDHVSLKFIEKKIL